MPTRIQPQFVELEQQREADTLGLWIFLATEVLFFGALFLAYAVYRISWPAAFSEAAKETNLVFGTINTVILLTSSLTMALAVNSAKQKRQPALFLSMTAVLGIAFMCVKILEYREDLEKALRPSSNGFFWLYYVMTGLHAFHLSIGIILVSFLSLRSALRTTSSSTVELTGLYWHFVDAIWVFLYPLLYLVNR